MLGIETLSFLASGGEIVGIVDSARLWALKAAGLSGVAPQGGNAFIGLVHTLEQNWIWLVSTGLGLVLVLIAGLMVSGSRQRTRLAVPGHRRDHADPRRDPGGARLSEAMRPLTSHSGPLAIAAVIMLDGAGGSAGAGPHLLVAACGPRADRWRAGRRVPRCSADSCSAGSAGRSA